MNSSCCPFESYTFTPFLEELTCSICLNIMTEPVIVCCNNKHTFGEKCIELSLKTSNKCPICSTIILDKKYSKNHLVANIVEKLERKCEHNECHWIGHNYTKHQGECDFVSIICICGTSYVRSDKNNHNNICSHTEIKCEFCNSIFKRKDLSIHSNTCSKFNPIYKMDFAVLNFVAKDDTKFLISGIELNIFWKDGIYFRCNDPRFHTVVFTSKINITIAGVSHHININHNICGRGVGWKKEIIHCNSDSVINMIMENITLQVLRNV